MSLVNFVNGTGNKATYRQRLTTVALDTLAEGNTQAGDLRRSESNYLYSFYNRQMEQDVWKDTLSFNTSPTITNYTTKLKGYLAYQPHRVLLKENHEQIAYRKVGNKLYELNDHLGNVRVVITDLKQPIVQTGLIVGLSADVSAYNNYYAFGMLQSGRNYVGSSGYRYGFNGKENDGETNTYDYGFRIYNPAIGKFLSVDPLTGKFPMLTPYQFASNTPIWAVDLDGLEARVYSDLSAIPHSFITVIDDDGVLNLYTFGQYGQKGSGLGGLYNTGSALVHLKGDDANAYMKHEFDNYSMGVYEISKERVDKAKIIEYYAKEMETYTIPADKSDKKHAPSYAKDENGSKAVKYKPYWLTPSGCDNENCSSVVNDGLQAGGLDFNVPAIPWLYNETLWEQTILGDDVKDVTSGAKKGANSNTNGSKPDTVKPAKVVKPGAK